MGVGGRHCVGGVLSSLCAMMFFCFLLLFLSLFEKSCRQDSVLSCRCCSEAMQVESGGGDSYVEVFDDVVEEVNMLPAVVSWVHRLLGRYEFDEQGAIDYEGLAKELLGYIAIRS